jgi:hypothetical protein
MRSVLALSIVIAAVLRVEAAAGVDGASTRRLSGVKLAMSLSHHSSSTHTLQRPVTTVTHVLGGQAITRDAHNMMCPAQLMPPALLGGQYSGQGKQVSGCVPRQKAAIHARLLIFLGRCAA